MADLVQAKLRVGAVDDPLEREADTDASGAEGGQLGTTTFGECSKAKENMGLFNASERYASDFDNVPDQLTGIFVHEVAHGLLTDALPRSQAAHEAEIYREPAAFIR